MRLLRNVLGFLSRNSVKEPFFTTNRLYSDTKTDSTPTKVDEEQSIKQIQKDDEPDLHTHEYNAALKNNFETGVSITAYNAVSTKKISKN